jgi:hypothetical protein
MILQAPRESRRAVTLCTFPCGRLISKCYRMIVGAPLDNITSALLMSKNVEHPGTVYRCNIARGGDCEPIIVDQSNVL